MPKAELSIIIPIYNEAESIRPLYESVVRHVAPMTVNFEVIFVNDGSTDQSLDQLKKIAASDSRVCAINFRNNAGQTAAMSAGIDYASGHYLVTMDGDLQNDPADITKMLRKLDEGYDLVVGWRINRQDDIVSRKLPSFIANRLIGFVTGLPIKDNGCSLKAYRASLIKRVPLYSDMHRFIPAMTLPFGPKIAQIGVSHHSRQYGESKYGLNRIYKVILDLIGMRMLLAFSMRPITIFSRLASLVALICLVSLVWDLIYKSAVDDSSSVVPLIIVILLGSLSVFLAFAGLVIGTVFKART